MKKVNIYILNHLSKTLDYHKSIKKDAVIAVCEHIKTWYFSKHEHNRIKILKMYFTDKTRSRNNK